MKNFFKAHPYIKIYIIVIIYASLLFGWGKMTRDVEWYLDGFSLWFSVGASIIGIGLSGLLLFFRYSPENTVPEKPATA